MVPKYRVEGDWYVSKTAWPLPKFVVETLGIDLFASARFVVLDCDEIYDLSGITGLSRLEELYINQFVHKGTDLGVLRRLRCLKKLTFADGLGIPKGDIATLAKSMPGVEVVLNE